MHFTTEFICKILYNTYGGWNKVENYFVHRNNGEVTRIAKIVDRALAYGWNAGKWVEMPGLLKIINDITDYEEISKEEAENLIGQG